MNLCQSLAFFRTGIFFAIMTHKSNLYVVLYVCVYSPSWMCCGVLPSFLCVFFVVADFYLTNYVRKSHSRQVSFSFLMSEFYGFGGVGG